MPSGSSPVREALESYVAGRLKPERLVITVAAAFYGAGGDAGSARGARGARREGVAAGEELQAVIDVIDRASPGIVELASVEGGPGFDVRLAERPFPTEFEAELRRVAAAVLARPGAPPARLPAPPPPPTAPPSSASAPGPAARPATDGVVVRLVRALRRLFSASA
ncbi:MAG TPA: hypothetical protein VH116_00680 [Gemmatimonadales bacterium]|jgi:hypothetical protein|nr:hypothetical protein [Gemmatimonadales bacterium]